MRIFPTGWEHGGLNGESDRCKMWGKSEGISMKNKKRLLRYVLIGVALFAAIAVLGGWLSLRSLTYAPMTEAMEAGSRPNVKHEGRTIIVEPQGEPVANFVFYQGGLVQTEAYAVLAQLLAEQGVRVFLPRMPLNLAIIQAGAFGGIYDKYNDGKRWWIGGHSLGGYSAASYAAKHPEQVAGIVLLGAYPGGNDLSGFPMKALSIHGGNDDIVNAERLAQGRSFLPSAARYVEIPGANHSQYGYYGFQKGDGASAISREEQHRIVVQAIMELLRK